MNNEERKQFDEYKSHSFMLSQIGSEVEEFCILSDEMTTLDAVKWLKAEWMILKGEFVKNQLHEKYGAK